MFHGYVLSLPTHAHDPLKHNATNTTELRETQNEYEALSYALRAMDEEGGSSPAERARLEANAKAARGALLAAAARLARVEEHAQVTFTCDVWAFDCFGFGVIWHAGSSGTIRMHDELMN